MPISQSSEKYFSTPSDIEEVKQYKYQETFTENDVSYVKVQIMLAEKLTFKTENVCEL